MKAENLTHRHPRDGTQGWPLGTRLFKKYSLKSCLPLSDQMKQPLLRTNQILQTLPSTLGILSCPLGTAPALLAPDLAL